MTLKLKPRERQLAAVAIGNIKLSQTSEEYGEAAEYLLEAEAAIFDLRFALSGRAGLEMVYPISKAKEVDRPKSGSGVIVDGKLTHGTK